MKYLLHIGFSIFLGLLFSSCKENATTTFEQPYVHIMQNDLSSITVVANRRDLASYYIYYSSPDYKEDLQVSYEITAGDGLQEGRDYQIVTTENPLSFPSGITRRPIQIRWMENELDPDKNNTLRITITETNLDVSIGLPGPDNNQSEFLITKVNN